LEADRLLRAANQEVSELQANLKAKQLASQCLYGAPPPSPHPALSNRMQGEAACQPVRVPNPNSNHELCHTPLKGGVRGRN
jgi:hypothetical protein